MKHISPSCHRLRSRTRPTARSCARSRSHGPQHVQPAWPALAPSSACPSRPVPASLPGPHGCQPCLASDLPKTPLSLNMFCTARRVATLKSRTAVVCSLTKAPIGLMQMMNKLFYVVFCFLSDSTYATANLSFKFLRGNLFTHTTCEGLLYVLDPRIIWSGKAHDAHEGPG